MDKQKHLEFIQNIINRMANCSFYLKGWTITLISAIFVLATAGSNFRYIIIVYLIVPFFWFLDAFYLSQERQYRDLYNNISQKKDNEIDYNLDVKKFNRGKNRWIATLFSKTLLPFYLPLMIGILIIMFCVNK
jgi:hypothetical protein